MTQLEVGEGKENHQPNICSSRHIRSEVPTEGVGDSTAEEEKEERDTQNEAETEQEAEEEEMEGERETESDGQSKELASALPSLCTGGDMEQWPYCKHST